MNNKSKILFNKAMHRMMLSCDTATMYITKKEYQKLSCKENLQLNMHLMGCRFCRAFNKQNAILSDKISLIQEYPPEAELSAEKKKDIQKALDNQHSK
jgi:L-rhamnose isomerase